MLRDLDWPVEMRIAPTVRDADGLALSSRNAYLTAEERREAPLLHAALGAARRAVEAGERRAAAALEAARAVLATGRLLRIDYLELVETEGLRPLEKIEGEVLIALAAFLGTTRLIDNVILDVRGGSVREADLRG
jgi:pantoate--beta-alanine ligase